MKKLLIIYLSSIVLTACFTSPPIPDSKRPIHWGKVIDKQDNFYQVSKDVFRSEQPTVTFENQLKTHQIRTIINLRNSNQNSDLKLPAAHSFNLIHYPIKTWKINRNDLLNVMLAIQQAKSRGEKVLIHCYHGSDRTGASITMYRIIFENWTIEDAVAEMKYGGYGFHIIWKNIESLFTPENVAWIKQEMLKHK